MTKRLLLSKQRQAIFVLMSLAVGLVISLGFLELAARIYMHTTKIPIRRDPVVFVEDPKGGELFDPGVGWKARPFYRDEVNGVFTNNHGMRMSENIDYEPEFYAKPRVLLVGDSMVFGFGVKQPFIFSEVLQREMPQLRVINTGVVGYNNVQEDVTMRRLLPVIRPQLSILFFCEANDALANDRNDHFMPYATLRGDGVVLHEASKYNPPSLYKRLDLWPVIDRLLKLRGKDLAYARDFIDLLLRKENSYVMRLETKLIEDIAQVSRSANTKLVIIDVPTFGEMRGEDTRNRVLQAVCRRVNVRYLNLKDVYPADSASLFLPNDQHWNQKGHRFIASLLENVVTEEINPQATASR
jgi:hypothetical protein